MEKLISEVSQEVTDEKKQADQNARDHRMGLFYKLADCTFFPDPFSTLIQPHAYTDSHAHTRQKEGSVSVIRCQ